jgi:hypothetical protein
MTTPSSEEPTKFPAVKKITHTSGPFNTVDPLALFVRSVVGFPGKEDKERVGAQTAWPGCLRSAAACRISQQVSDTVTNFTSALKK